MERESANYHKKKAAGLGEYSNVAFAIEVFRNRLVNTRDRLVKLREGRRSRQSSQRDSSVRDSGSSTDGGGGGAALADCRDSPSFDVLPPLTADAAARAATKAAPRGSRFAPSRVTPAPSAAPALTGSVAAEEGGPAAGTEAGESTKVDTTGLNQEWARQLRGEARDQKRANALNRLPSLPTAVPLAVPTPSTRGRFSAGGFSKRTSSPRRGARCWR